jgi:hypothetical protein
MKSARARVRSGSTDCTEGTQIGEKVEEQTETSGVPPRQQPETLNYQLSAINFLSSRVRSEEIAGGLPHTAFLFEGDGVEGRVEVIEGRLELGDDEFALKDLAIRVGQAGLGKCRGQCAAFAGPKRLAGRAQRGYPICGGDRLLKLGRRRDPAFQVAAFIDFLEPRLYRIDGGGVRCFKGFRCGALQCNQTDNRHDQRRREPTKKSVGVAICHRNFRCRGADDAEEIQLGGSYDDIAVAAIDVEPPFREFVGAGLGFIEHWTTQSVAAMPTGAEQDGTAHRFGEDQDRVGMASFATSLSQAGKRACGWRPKMSRYGGDDDLARFGKTGAPAGSADHTGHLSALGDGFRRFELLLRHDRRDRGPLGSSSRVTRPHLGLQAFGEAFCGCGLDTPFSKAPELKPILPNSLEGCRNAAALLLCSPLAQRESDSLQPSIGLRVTDRGQRQKCNFGLVAMHSIGAFADHLPHGKVEVVAVFNDDLEQIFADFENVEQMEETV